MLTQPGDELRLLAVDRDFLHCSGNRSCAAPTIGCMYEDGARFSAVVPLARGTGGRASFRVWVAVRQDSMEAQSLQEFADAAESHATRVGAARHRLPHRGRPVERSLDACSRAP